MLTFYREHKDTSLLFSKKKNLSCLEKRLLINLIDRLNYFEKRSQSNRLMLRI